MRRPNMSVLAKEAGVSLSTVDRVLNGRADVREETARLVLEAAERIGFYATPLLRQRLKVDVPERTFGFLLQRRSTAFYRLLGDALGHAAEAAPAVRGRAVVEFMEDLTPGAVADALGRMGKAADAVAMVAADHPTVTAAIDGLAAREIPVVALVSDLTAASRAGYVGLDNRKVGRTAAWFLRNMRPADAKIAILVGSHRYLCQEACEIGFRSYLREHAPGAILVEPVATFESDRYAHEATLDLLRRHPDLAGLYVAGGGIGGVIAALEDSGVHRPTTIGHDLTETTAAGLIGGALSAVLSHPIDRIARQTVDLLVEKTLDRTAAMSFAQRILPFEIATPESL